MTELMSTISLADLEGGASPREDRAAARAARDAARLATNAATEALEAVDDAKKAAKKAKDASRSASRSASPTGKGKGKGKGKGRNGKKLTTKPAAKPKSSKRARVVSSSPRSKTERAPRKRRHGNCVVSARVLKALCKEQGAGEVALSGVSQGYIDSLHADAVTFAIKITSGHTAAREIAFVARTVDPACVRHANPAPKAEKGKTYSEAARKALVVKQKEAIDAAPMKGLVYTARLQRAMKARRVPTRFVNTSIKGFPAVHYPFFGQQKPGQQRLKREGVKKLGTYKVSGMEVVAALVAGHIAARVHNDRVLLAGLHAREEGVKTHILSARGISNAHGLQASMSSSAAARSARAKHASLRKTMSKEDKDVLRKRLASVRAKK